MNDYQIDNSNKQIEQESINKKKPGLVDFQEKDNIKVHPQNEKIKEKQKKYMQKRLTQAKNINQVVNPFQGIKEEKIQYFYKYLNSNDSITIHQFKLFIMVLVWPIITVYLFVDLIILEIAIFVMYVVYYILDCIFEQFLRIYVFISHNSATEKLDSFFIRKIPQPRITQKIESKFIHK